MKSKLKNRVPVLLSTLVCPGLGQLVQKQRVAGALICVSFIASFIWFIICAGRIIISYYQLGLQFETAEVEIVSATTLLPAFGLSVLTYSINVFDVSRAQQLIKRAAREKAFMKNDSGG